jgi:serine/threonine-protein kinase
MALEPAKFSDFKLAGALGTGATAKVYEAVQIATGRPVAIKVMEQSNQTPEMRERFAREALLLADVHSRHVSQIIGFGFERGQPFLVLELLQGETLDAKLRRDGPVPLPLAVRWIEQLIIGVRDCHTAKVIHRDIKPANIFLHKDGFDEVVKLIDFGVARLREISGGMPVNELTSANHLIGSMGYMAPEQFKSAKSVNFTADLYAVGVVTFRTLTGRLPFVSRSLEAVIRMKTEQPVPAISSMPGMVQNPMLDWFVEKAMTRDPAARFQSAREMLEHWRNFMGSLDNEGGGRDDFGRVDESYAGQRPRPPAYDNDDEHTIRRPPISMAPNTLTDPPLPTLEHPSHGEPPTRSLDDVYELPTRSDPNLKKLVERELELQKARKGR